MAWLLYKPAIEVDVLVAEQQPPLHGCVLLQDVVQVWLVVLQAWPVGQQISFPSWQISQWSSCEQQMLALLRQ